MKKCAATVDLLFGRVNRLTRWTLVTQSIRLMLALSFVGLYFEIKLISAHWSSKKHGDI